MTFAEAMAELKAETGRIVRRRAWPEHVMVVWEGDTDPAIYRDADVAAEDWERSATPVPHDERRFYMDAKIWLKQQSGK